MSEVMNSTTGRRRFFMALLFALTLTAPFAVKAAPVETSGGCCGAGGACFQDYLCVNEDDCDGYECCMGACI